MSGPAAIEGFAIVSEDGMLAGADGVMPQTLKFDADQKFFADGLDRMAAVVHGRHSHEQQPHSPQRKRLMVTRSVAALDVDPNNQRALFWNPAGASLEQAWAALKLDGGGCGIIGGTDVFGLFLGRYDLFHLSRAPGKLPGGRPVFPQVPRLTPEEIMQEHGMAAGETQVLDAAHGVTLTTWRRGV